MLQRLCLLILQHKEYQVGTGMRQIYGILFDGAWLWEEYINTLIENAFYHPMNKGGKGAQWLFAGNYGVIYPDFISKDSQKRIIADAKYKPADNIRNKDYLQMLAYMFCFEARSGYYIYPEAGNSKDLYLYLNKGLTCEKNVARSEDVNITKRGLKIPSVAEDYEEFVVMMHRSEEEFIARLGR